VGLFPEGMGLKGNGPKKFRPRGWGRKKRSLKRGLGGGEGEAVEAVRESGHFWGRGKGRSPKNREHTDKKINRGKGEKKGVNEGF